MSRREDRKIFQATRASKGPDDMTPDELRAEMIAMHKAFGATITDDILADIDAEIGRFLARRKGKQ